MARGWESKSVESQIEAAAAGRARGREPAASAGDQERDTRRNLLTLHRTRVQGELQTTCNPRFREQLEAELKYLDGEITKLGPH